MCCSRTVPLFIDQWSNSSPEWLGCELDTQLNCLVTLLQIAFRVIFAYRNALSSHQVILFEWRIEQEDMEVLFFTGKRTADTPTYTFDADYEKIFQNLNQDNLSYIRAQLMEKTQVETPLQIDRVDLPTAKLKTKTLQHNLTNLSVEEPQNSETLSRQFKIQKREANCSTKSNLVDQLTSYLKKLSETDGCQPAQPQHSESVQSSRRNAQKLEKLLTNEKLQNMILVKELHKYKKLDRQNCQELDHLQSKLKKLQQENTKLKQLLKEEQLNKSKIRHLVEDRQSQSRRSSKPVSSRESRMQLLDEVLLRNYIDMRTRHRR